MRITRRQLRGIIRENLRQYSTEEDAVGKLYAALGEHNQQIFMSLSGNQQFELARKWVVDGMPGCRLVERRH
tara:strand:- start:692 stop:907 length:216 start_codon:yes stop_codon:yes gene_type:complete